MPAKNPRLTITLQPTLAAQLRRLSELTGNSQSSLIAELLEGSTPVFDRMIVLLEAAHQAKEAMRGQVVEGLDQAQAKLEKQMGLALDTWDTAAAPLLDQMEAIKRRAKASAGAPGGARAAGRSRSAGGGKRGTATPPSNRGVRSTPDKPKKSTRTRT
jgi:hypothetical protein